MTGKDEYRGPQSEDLVWKQVGESPYYGKSATGKVDVIPVKSGASVLGFLWYAEQDAAAGFVVASSAGGVGINAGFTWSKELAACKAAGLSAKGAIDQMSEIGSLGRYGRLLMGDVREFNSVEEVKALALMS